MYHCLLLVRQMSRMFYSVTIANLSLIRLHVQPTHESEANHKTDVFWLDVYMYYS